MAKRKTDFTTQDKTGVDVINTIATKDAAEAQDTKNEYRFSARFTPEQWHFITEKKWRTRRSITQILQDYVNEDIKKHPEILESIDELN
jgi:hypothetical protein